MRYGQFNIQKVWTSQWDRERPQVADVGTSEREKPIIAISTTIVQYIMYLVGWLFIITITIINRSTSHTIVRDPRIPITRSEISPIFQLYVPGSLLSSCLKFVLLTTWLPIAALNPVPGAPNLCRSSSINAFGT